MIETPFNELLRLVGGTEIAASTVQLDGAIHLHGGVGPFRLGCKVVEGFSFPDKYGELLAAWDRAHPSERSGPKYCIRSIHRWAGGATVALAKTTWREARSVHDSLKQESNDQMRRDLLLAYLADSDVSLPNIAVVHSIVETSDNFIALAQRSSSVYYHPLRWSATFEEGLEPDEDVGHYFEAAAVRGLREEFQVTDVRSVHVVAVALEWPIINPAVVVYCTVGASLEELRAGASVCEEIGTVEGISDTPELIAANASGLGISPNWHPTARYRLVCALAHKFGSDTSRDALIAATQPSRMGRGRE